MKEGENEEECKDEERERYLVQGKRDVGVKEGRMKGLKDWREYGMERVV